MALTSAQAAVIYAATEGIKTLVELIIRARRYPDMTPEEADKMVADTTATAQATLRDWRTFRGQ
jgi:hypothetical protein